MTAADYINEYVARRAPIDMVAPWRSSKPLVKALWFKQARWAAEATVANCAKPSAEYDEAYDAMVTAKLQHMSLTIDAWKNRAIERFAVRVAA